jgi:undecaprenyl-diphosphatase
MIYKLSIFKFSALCFNRLMLWDKSLCINVNKASQIRALRVLFRTVSRLGDGVFWYTVMVGILMTKGDAAIVPVLTMLSAGLTGTLVYKWIKGKTLRPRPYEVHQDIWLTGRPLDRFSFPSGHTLHAVAFTVTGLYFYPELTLLLLPFTALVAMSRVVLGLHYPSDVLAGASIGGLIATLYLVI